MLNKSMAWNTPADFFRIIKMCWKTLVGRENVIWEREGGILFNRVGSVR